MLKAVKERANALADIRPANSVYSHHSPDFRELSTLHLIGPTDSPPTVTPLLLRVLTLSVPLKYFVVSG